MSIRRQPPLAVSDEKFLVVRTLRAQCAAGLRTSSPTAGWHRLIAAGEGVIIVRTPQRAWSTPAANAVWVPQGVRCDLEMCSRTSLRMLYIRPKKSALLPTICCAIGVSPLMRELIARIVDQAAIDRRIDWQAALYQLLLHEIRQMAQNPIELIWPADARLARIAALVQSKPSDRRRLRELCKGQGVSPRTVVRLFPLETGLHFERWRQRVRILHATRLLSDGGKIIDVAEQCGYQSASAFAAAFKSIAGVAPREFLTEKSRVGGPIYL